MNFNYQWKNWCRPLNTTMYRTVLIVGRRKKKIITVESSLLWDGTSRPIIWNKNLRSLYVSVVWMYILTLGKPLPIRTSSRLDVEYGICQALPSDILSIFIIIYFNRQYWLYTWYFILYVKKFGGFFNICCSFMFCNTHVTCYLYRSLCMIYL